MSDFALLKNINDIDDDLVFEAENWKRPKTNKLRIGIVAAAAAVLCGATAVTAIANIKPPKEVIIYDEPIDVDYTVYTDAQGREIRTYAYNLPDYALGEEKEGCTAVGQVRVVANNDDPADWEIVDEEGNVFDVGINNKQVQCDVIDSNNPHTHHDIGFMCANFLSKDYDIFMYYDKDLDGDNLPDKIYVYVYPFGDKEAAKRIYEKHGEELNEEIFDRMCEHHRKLYSMSDDPSEDTADEE